MAEEVDEEEEGPALQEWGGSEGPSSKPSSISSSTPSSMPGPLPCQEPVSSSAPPPIVECVRLALCCHRTTAPLIGRACGQVSGWVGGSPATAIDVGVGQG